MKILTAQAQQFITGDVLCPRDLNAVYEQARSSLEDVVERRLQRSALTLQFVESMATPYTEASSTECRTYRFTCPETCVVERAFLSANLVSSAEVKVTIADTGGNTPAGATVPWLTTGGAVAAATTHTQDLNANRVLLVAGTEYLITVAAAGAVTYTLTRFDVTLHLVTDRFIPAGSIVAPSFAPTLFTDASAPNATTVAANGTALTTAAGTLASRLVASTPLLFVKHNVVTGTDADIRKFALPRWDSARAQSRAVALYAFATWDASVTASATVELQTGGGAPLLTATASAVAATFARGSTTSTASLVTGTVGASALSAQDYVVVLTNSSATNAKKLYGILWLSR